MSLNITRPWPPVAVPSANKRFSVYYDGGMTISGAPTVSNLYASQAAIDAYTAVIINCNGGPYYSVGQLVEGRSTVTATAKGIFVNYANKGGRLFMDHFPGEPLIKFSTNPTWASTNVATWYSNSSISGSTEKAHATQGSASPTGAAALQAQFTQWLTAAAANGLYGPDFVPVDNPRQYSKQVGPLAIEWLRGLQGSSSWNGVGGDETLSFSFETGTGATNDGVGTTCDGTATGGHGRVMFNDIHVGAIRGTGGTFPGNCSSTTQKPTSEEKTLEYQLFQLTACQLGGAVAPPPPVPPLLPSITFTRDFEAVCPAGNSPVWKPFYWEAVIPSAVTKIDFAAGTATTQAGLPAASTDPGVKPIGTATGTVVAPAWDCEGCPGAPVSVDYSLRNDPPPPNPGSQQWLRVFMTFTPDNTGVPRMAPTLTAWRQVYDCVPNE
jgi:hypothetical protein